MRIIKLAILSFIFLFLLVTTISLFIPSHIRISKAINVYASDEEVAHYVSDLTNWKLWHPAMKNLHENDIQVRENGSLYIHGTMISVVDKKQDEFITELKKEGGRPVRSGIKFVHHPEPGLLTLQWWMDFRLRWYPWEKFKSLFYENIYGVQMEQGLANLKQLLETDRPSFNK